MAVGKLAVVAIEVDGTAQMGGAVVGKAGGFDAHPVGFGVIGCLGVNGAAVVSQVIGEAGCHDFRMSLLIVNRPANPILTIACRISAESAECKECVPQDSNSSTAASSAAGNGGMHPAQGNVQHGQCAEFSEIDGFGGGKDHVTHTQTEITVNLKRIVCVDPRDDG